MHTQRANRGDVMAFVAFLGVPWPAESWKMFSVSVADVHRFRDAMVERNMAPKTINRRISSLSSFFKYLSGCAAEFRLPIVVPNPAQVIKPQMTQMAADEGYRCGAQTVCAPDVDLRN